MAQVAIFLVVVLLVTFGLHYLLWARLIRDPGWPEFWARVATAAIVSLAMSLPAAMALGRALPRPVSSPLAWVAFVWMGTSFLLFVCVLVGDVAMVGARMTAWYTDPSRRQFLSRALAMTVGFAGFGLSGAAVTRALDALRVRTVRVPLKRLPPALDGMTVVQLTDIHVGPTIGREFIAEMVRRVNALSPDVIAITGDLVDGSVASLRAQVAPLADLRAKHGVFFVTGNHEYYSGVDDWIAELHALGIRVLRNERVTVGEGEHTIDLVGVDDWSAKRFGKGHGADLARALRDRDATREAVLLAHQPKAIVEAAAQGVGLVLSGHTHGGQIWPFSYLVRLDQPYLAGLHRHDDTWIYVSEGTGYWGPPMRLGTHGEITRLVLTRG